MSLQFILTEQLISDMTHLQPDIHEGARICFRGYVRDNNPYKNVSNVVAIEYMCYQELAYKEGMCILQNAQSQYALQRIVCIHRIGLVKLQEASLHIEITSTHREQAFQAVQYIIDSIKQSLPVWKKEITSTGERIWT